MNPVLTQSPAETAPDPTQTDTVSGHGGPGGHRPDTASILPARRPSFSLAQGLENITAEGPKTSEFAVDLPALLNATNQISGYRDEINGSLRAVETSFTNISFYWRGPAGTDAQHLFDSFKTVTGNFMNLLNDAIDRMNTAYNNYLDAETTNVSNLTK